VDQRALDAVIDEELSIGDYVLTGGELGALVVIDAVARLVPGVLGSDESSEDESFTTGLLEYPQYTRPAVWHGRAIPEILTSGNHEKVRQWRRKQALRRTRERRPDMYEKLDLSSKQDKKLLKEMEQEDLDT
jgi:tRNA (guanine37-N1)-methyltransferase